METPQPPQVSVSGRIVIEGQLPASSGANSENAPAPSSPPWWKFWKPAPPEFALPRATVWLVIATFILAAIALGQACILLTTDASTRKAANAADTSARTLETALQTVRDNFRAEQRPIIWLGPVWSPRFLTFPSSGSGGDNLGHIAWNWSYRNYGKTPALKVSTKDFMSINGKVEPNLNQMDSAVPIPPNQEGDDFNTILSKATISQDDYNTLLKIDNAIIISGRITYEDAYGNKYETQFCLGKLAGGPNAHCKEGNDIK
jgi:type II secretory pathway pseudopilin PulG